MVSTTRYNRSIVISFIIIFPLLLDDLSYLPGRSSHTTETTYVLAKDSLPMHMNSSRSQQLKALLSAASKSY